MRLPRLSHGAPEEIFLVPVALIVIVGVLLQPGAITRLFESPYATPAPDAPGRSLLQGPSLATPAPAPAPGQSPTSILAQWGDLVTSVCTDRSGRAVSVLWPRTAEGPPLPNGRVAVACTWSSSDDASAVHAYVGRGPFVTSRCPEATVERTLPAPASGGPDVVVCVATARVPVTGPVPVLRRN